MARTKSFKVSYKTGKKNDKGKPETKKIGFTTPSYDDLLPKEIRALAESMLYTLSARFAGTKAEALYPRVAAFTKTLEKMSKKFGREAALEFLLEDSAEKDSKYLPKMPDTINVRITDLFEDSGIKAEVEEKDEAVNDSSDDSAEESVADAILGDEENESGDESDAGLAEADSDDPVTDAILNDDRTSLGPEV